MVIMPELELFGDIPIECMSAATNTLAMASVNIDANHAKKR
jgi:hypothetical protein